MYYKVVNKESEVYKKLRDQREKELAAEKRNEEKLNELLGFEFQSFYGRMGVQNLHRVNRYTAFVPVDVSLVTKAVRLSKDYKDGYVPNLRTKAGRELQKFLSNGMESFNFRQVLKILGCETFYGRFTIPFMMMVEDVILLYLDERNVPIQEDVIEITRTEFDGFLKRKKKND